MTSWSVAMATESDLVDGDDLSVWVGLQAKTGNVSDVGAD